MKTERRASALLDPGAGQAPTRDMGESFSLHGLWTASKTAIREGRGPVLWALGLLTGLIAGYATLGLRLGIIAVEGWVYGASDERLTSAASALPPGLLLALPLGAGIVIALLLLAGERWFGLTHYRAKGVADLIEARAVKGADIPLRSGLYSALLAVLSLGGGASAGREGPAVHLGGTLAAALARVLQLEARGRRVLLACGAAAAVSASFNAPVAGALFAFEVVLGHYALRSIAPVAISSVIGALIARAHLGADPVFVITDMVAGGIWDLPAAIVFGIAAAGLAIAFVRGALHLPMWSEQMAKTLRIPLWALPIPGGLGLGLMALIAPEVLGVGYETTLRAIEGYYTPLALIALIAMKVIATHLTLASRFAGGVFSPSLVLGAMLGASFGAVLHALSGGSTADAGFYAVIGMGTVAGAVLGAPLSTTLIVFEMTSSYSASVIVLVSVSMATVLTQSALGGSLFHRQIRQRGYDVAGGASRLVLQTIRAREVMMPLEDWSREIEPGSACVYEDDTLGRVMGVLEAEQVDGVPVRRRGDEEPVTGWIGTVDAHSAYARALADISEEEHR